MMNLQKFHKVKTNSPAVEEGWGMHTMCASQTDDIC